MSMTDPIADLLTRIRNAAQARHTKVTIRYSKQKEQMLRILAREGYIKGFKTSEGPKKDFEVELKYYKKKPAFKEMARVSKPGRRVYVGHDDIKPVHNNMGIGIISTSKGILTAQKAKAEGIGGEYLCTIY